VTYSIADDDYWSLPYKNNSGFRTSLTLCYLCKKNDIEFRKLNLYNRCYFDKWNDSTRRIFSLVILCNNNFFVSSCLPLPIHFLLMVLVQYCFCFSSLEIVGKFVYVIYYHQLTSFLFYIKSIWYRSKQIHYFPQSF